jgi:cell division protein FtsL
VLLLVVGVLVTSAVTLIAGAHVYRQLDGSLQPAI